MKHRFWRYLPLILKLNLAFLVGFMVLTLAFPLYMSERFVFVLPAGTLAGITWALIDHLRKSRAQFREQDPVEGPNHTRP